jgi:acyl carrier protein phosphodiesterase
MEGSMDSTRRKPLAYIGARAIPRWVADFFLLPEGAWNMQWLNQYFQQEDIAEILKIHASRRSEEDFVSWYPEKLGIFTVKSAYQLLALHK